MSSIYERLGVPTLINATGPATRLSGSLLPAEVTEAMKEASQYCVDMTELQARASQNARQDVMPELIGSERMRQRRRLGCVSKINL